MVTPKVRQIKSCKNSLFYNNFMDFLLQGDSLILDHSFVPKNSLFNKTSPSKMEERRKPLCGLTGSVRLSGTDWLTDWRTGVNHREAFASNKPDIKPWIFGPIPLLNHSALSTATVCSLKSKPFTCYTLETCYSGWGISKQQCNEMWIKFISSLNDNMLVRYIPWDQGKRKFNLSVTRASEILICPLKFVNFCNKACNYETKLFLLSIRFFCWITLSFYSAEQPVCHLKSCEIICFCYYR